MRQTILKDPKSFPKNFSHQNEAYLMPSKSKKNEARKAKKRGGEKAKSKSQDCYNDDDETFI